MGYSTNPECFVVNDGANSNNLLTAALMNGNGGMGGFNSPFWAFIMLAFLRQWGWDGNGNGNGNGCNCLTNNQLSQIQETLNTNQGNTLLMNAITQNGTTVKELATALNCNFNAVQSAINGIQSAIYSLGSKNDMNAMQIVNAINSGDSMLANQLSSCCCDVKQLVTTQGYENRIANLQQSQLIQNGFCQVGYEAAQNANGIRQSINDQTLAVLGKLDAQEDARKDREITALTAELATVKARAERQAELAPIIQKLNDIQCKQPNTVTLPYSCATAVPTNLVYQGLYGAYGLNGTGVFG